MNQIYDYKRFVILYVDDEEKSLKYFTRAFSDTFRILTATNAADGFRLLETHQAEIGLVMSDQRMPGEQGVQFLERARKLRPQIIRILATAYADLDAAIAAVNTGAIYKYVTKPWDVADLEITLKRSLEFFMVQMERDLLMREKLSTLHKLLITDRVLSLGVLASGLGQHMRHSLDAVRNFLELAGDSSPGGQVDLNQLRNPNFWPDFHNNVRVRLKLILGLLDDLSAETGMPFRFDTEVRLHEVVAQAIEKLGSEIAQRRLVIDIKVPKTLPPLLVDERRFRKLFTFLLRNELAILPEGGTVQIEAAMGAASGDKAQEIDIFVNDNGPGIPKDAMTTMFDPLQPELGDARDIGVYLMACFFIVYHHGGRIEVGRAGQTGSALALTVPLRPPIATAADEREDFLLRAMTSERLWERLLAGT